MMTTAVAPAGPMCPKCGSDMWDNRAEKRNPKAPDYRCKNRACDGAIWPPKPGVAVQTAPKGNPYSLPPTEPVSVPHEAEYLALVERVGARLMDLASANRAWPVVCMADIQAVAATIFIQAQKARGAA